MPMTICLTVYRLLLLNKKDRGANRDGLIRLRARILCENTQKNFAKQHLPKIFSRFTLRDHQALNSRDAAQPRLTTKTPSP